MECHAKQFLNRKTDAMKRILYVSIVLALLGLAAETAQAAGGRYKYDLFRHGQRGLYFGFDIGSRGHSKLGYGYYSIRRVGLDYQRSRSHRDRQLIDYYYDGNDRSLGHYYSGKKYSKKYGGHRDYRGARH